MPIEKESVTQQTFNKNDGMIKGKHMVWGRVAIIDTNFYPFKFTRECWNKETAKAFLIDLEEYLVDILNIDFLLLDLNYSSIDSIKQNPSLLLLGYTEKILTLQNDHDLQELKKEAYAELLELEVLLRVGQKKKVNYGIN